MSYVFVDFQYRRLERIGSLPILQAAIFIDQPIGLRSYIRPVHAKYFPGAVNKETSFMSFSDEPNPHYAWGNIKRYMELSSESIKDISPFSINVHFNKAIGMEPMDQELLSMLGLINKATDIIKESGHPKFIMKEIKE